MNHIRMLLALSIMLATSSVTTPCQTIGPSTLFDALTTAADSSMVDSLYVERPAFILGWNWGGALRGINEDLHTNIHHMGYPFQFDALADQRSFHPIRSFPNQNAMIMAPSWSIPRDTFWDPTTQVTIDNSYYPWYADAASDDITNHGTTLNFTVGQTVYACLTESLGMRFEPELDVSDTTTFTPRNGDQQGAIWGFRTHDLTNGSIPSSTTDENFHRYVLDSSGITGWTTVLNSSWPDQRIGRLDKLNQFEEMRSFNGDKLYLGINLRRVHDDDTLMGDSVLLRLRVHYLTVGDNTDHLVHFDSLPHPTEANYDLPLTLDGQGRGRARPLQVRQGGGAVTEVIITRNMIPRGDDTTRDVTIMAHFNLVDDRPNFNDHGVGNDDYNAFLRDTWSTMSDFATTGADNGLIHRMWVQVDYAGHSDIAIDWVQIGSENYTWLTQGFHDTLILHAYQQMAGNLRAYNDTCYNGQLQNRARIWRWYNRDEGQECYWNGMRYVHQLFDNRTTTEKDMIRLDAGFHDRYLHTTGIRDLWEGTTPIVSPRVVAPYYRHGTRGTFPDVDYFGCRNGISDDLWPLPDTIDYDLNYGDPRPSDGTYALPPDMADTLTPGETYPVGEENNVPGLQATYESLRWVLHENPDYLLSDSTIWLANLWAAPDINQEESGAGHDLAMPAWGTRFLTGEETSLLAWSHVILGAKGLMWYWGTSADSLTQPLSYDIISMGMSYAPAKDFLSRWQPDGLGGWEPVPWPGLPRYNNDLDANQVLVDGRNTWLHNLTARDADAGEDWLDADESTGFWQALHDAMNETDYDDIMDNLYEDYTVGELYTGKHSIRSSMKTIHDVLSRAASDLDSLRLLVWYSKGFRTWTVGDEETLSAVFDVEELRTRHPQRDGSSHTITWDPSDSTFAELTVLQDGTHAFDSTFVIGVLNRRCNPFDFQVDTVAAAGAVPADVNHVNLDTYRTYQDHWERILADNSTKMETRYRQSGSRTVEIPFNYEAPDGLSHNLRVQRLGVVNEDSLAIIELDTIIGAHTKLRLTLLPGEGAMLRVTPMPANTYNQVGFLDNSNQRKMVAYPKLDTWELHTDTLDSRTYMRQVHGDTMWYHRVFHKRRNDVGAGGTQALSVYYQRSHPLLDGDTATGSAQYMFSASTITWEEPILLSSAVIYDGDTSDYSCGYPAIVVRPDTTDPNWKVKVYAVFSCEKDTTAGEILICEAVLPAEATRAAQVSYLNNNPSQSIAFTLGLATDHPLLKEWGTPMINASAKGNFYCWSHAYSGIGVGFKEPDKRQFTGPTSMFINDYWGGGQHPSLNTYSRLHLGEEDACLVWATNAKTMILMTRLYIDAFGAIQNKLYSSTTSFTVGPALTSYWDPNIAMIDGNAPYFNGNTYASTVDYPVVHLNLPDWDYGTWSWKYNLGLVNHKAMRIYWEAKLLPPQGDNRRVIGRRNADVAEWSIIGSVQDTLWSQIPHYIYSDSLMSLQGPTVAQGTAWGSPESSIPDSSSTYEDSTAILEFWSDSVGVSSAPRMWSLTYGWSWYGQNSDHNYANLVDDGILEQLHEIGRYPQLAERYSMTQYPGWQRGRRTFDADGGNWYTYLSAPSLGTSSEYFYKGAEEQRPHAYVYAGFRGELGSCTMGPVWLSESKRWVPCQIEDTETAEGRTMVTTDWFPLRSIEDVSVMSQGWYDDEAIGTAFIQRQSDGQRFNLYAFARNQGGKVYRARYTMISDPNEAYRLVLVSNDNGFYPVQDIEVGYDTDERFMKGSQGSTIMDLRYEGERVTTTGSLLVFPNPAEGHFRVVVDLRSDQGGVKGHVGVRLQIFALDGQRVCDQVCRPVDVVSVDTASWSAGTYQVVLTDSKGKTYTEMVVISN